MISNNHVYINMHFYCKSCYKEAKADLENHRLCGKLVQTQTSNNPKISDIDRTFYDYVINHINNFEIYTIEVTFEKKIDNNSYSTF